MDIGGLGSFVLELSKTVLDAKKELPKEARSKSIHRGFGNEF